MRAGPAIVVPAEDPQALVKAVTTVASDPCLAERLVRSAGHDANGHFDRTTLLARAEAFVENLVISASGTGPAETLRSGLPSSS